MAKTFPLRLDEKLHKRMKHASVDTGETLHDWILGAILNRLGDEKSGVHYGRQGSQTKKTEKNKSRR